MWRIAAFHHCLALLERWQSHCFEHSSGSFIARHDPEHIRRRQCWGSSPLPSLRQLQLLAAALG